MKRTANRIALGVAALALVGAAWLGSAAADTGEPIQDQSAAATDALREHMGAMRDIMHNAQFTTEAQPDGVVVYVTAENEVLVQAIRDEFAGDRHPVFSTLIGSEVAVQVIEGGVALNYSALDEAVVSELQAQGSGLVYALLQQNMHATMVALQASGGFGGAMGWMHGNGTMGSGRMHGNGTMGSGGMHGNGTMGSGGMHGSGMGGGWMHGNRQQAQPQEGPL